MTATLLRFGLSLGTSGLSYMATSLASEQRPYSQGTSNSCG